MNKNRLLILMLFLVVITSITVVSAGIFDFNDNTIKTHEFNYSNKVIFNISDELTDKTGVENILFGQGVSYEYPANGSDESGLINNLVGLSKDIGKSIVEGRQNDALFKEIESNSTSQGFETYIFQIDDNEEYEVYIDLNESTIVEDDGYEYQYDYFWGTFQSLDEAKIFIDTFKLNENAVKGGL